MKKLLRKIYLWLRLKLGRMNKLDRIRESNTLSEKTNEILTSIQDHFNSAECSGAFRNITLDNNDNLMFMVGTDVFKLAGTIHLAKGKTANSLIRFTTYKIVPDYSDYPKQKTEEVEQLQFKFYASGLVGYVVFKEHSRNLSTKDAPKLYFDSLVNFILPDYQD